MSTRKVTMFLACLAFALAGMACNSDSSGDTTKSAEKRSPKKQPASAKPAPPATAPPATAPPASATPGASESDSLPAGHPPITGAGSVGQPGRGQMPASAGASIEGSTLKLAGIELTIPDGWLPEPPGSSPMAPKAVFKVAGAEGDANGCEVRITHFPGMKGMDRQNIDRWISQVRQPDGSTSTRENAKIETKEIGHVRLTIVDLSGSVNTSMDGTSGGGKPNYRLMAAIVDHPKGPHFVKAQGTTDSMEKCAPSVRAFIESVKVR